MSNSAKIIENPIENYPSATVACFDPTSGELPRRQLDPQLTIQFLEKLSLAGAESLLIAASTGQGHLRSVEELSEWFRIAADAKLGSTQKMALLRPEDGESANRQLVELLQQCQYDVVFIRPGNNLGKESTPQQIADNMRPILDACFEAQLPVGVYSISDVSGVALTPDAVAILLDSPAGKNIVAVKVTEADFEESTGKMLADPRLNRLKIVQGWDPHLATALQRDPIRCGVTSGAMSLCLFQYLHILEAAKNQNWQEAKRAQVAVTQLFSAMQDDPTKFANLQIAKFAMGLGHPITDQISETQTAKLWQAVEEIDNDSDRERIHRSLHLMQ